MSWRITNVSETCSKATGKWNNSNGSGLRRVNWTIWTCLQLRPVQFNSVQFLRYDWFVRIENWPTQIAAAVANRFGRSASSQPFVCLCLGLSTAAYIPTLLHGPECNLGDWHGVPSSCAPLGGFAIGTLVSLLGQHIWTKCQRVLVLTLCLFVDP